MHQQTVCRAFTVIDDPFFKGEMMFDFVRVMKLTSRLAAAMIAATVVIVSPAQAGTGTVHLRIVKGGFIIGGGGGDGTLTFDGRRYPLRVGGAGIGTIGISETRLFGTASNLHSPGDIVGTYSMAGAGLAVGGGANVVTLRNERGVVLRLQGTQVGFQASLGVGGLTISMR
jgi:hypothetical protein